jgi:hypothetical protein
MRCTALHDIVNPSRYKIQDHNHGQKVKIPSVQAEDKEAARKRRTVRIWWEVSSRPGFDERRAAEDSVE